MSDSFDESSPVSDQITETSTEGWGSRIGGGLIASLIGLILVPAAIALMYWNEGRAVAAIRALDRGAASILEVSADAVSPQTSGKLVHVTGMLKPGTPARDEMFGVTADGVVRLERTAEMYQWKEETESHSEQSVGGSKTTTKTYKYQRVWSDSQINSGGFRSPSGHQNPTMGVHSATFDAADIRLGAWRLDPSVLRKVTAFEPFHPIAAPPAGFQAAGEGYYQGANPGTPAIGDVRVSFKAVTAQTVSVAAADASGVLTAYRDANGFSIAIAEPGAVSAAGLFHDEKKSESTLTWILRGVGFVMVLIGFVCIARPLTMLFAILPFLGDLVGAGVFLIAVTLAVPVTLLTISVAWIVHRPVIGGLLLVAAIGGWVLLRRLHPRRTLPAMAR